MCNTPNSYKKFDVTGLNFSPQETKFSPPLDATHDEQSSTLPLLASYAAVPHTTPPLLLSHAGAARVLCAVSPLFPSHVQSHRCSSPACNAGAHMEQSTPPPHRALLSCSSEKLAPPHSSDALTCLLAI
jgi:hypothetical protein